MIVQGSHTFAKFYAHAHMRYMKNGEYPSHYFDDLYLICSEQHCGEYVCIVWLYHAYSYTVGPKKAINLAPLFKDIRETFFFPACVCVCVCNWYAGSPSLV